MIFLVFAMMVLPNLAASAELLDPAQQQYRGGRETAILRNNAYETIGAAQYWNTKTKFVIELILFEDYHLENAEVFAGTENELPPMAADNNVQPGAFPCKRVYTDEFPQTTMIQCDLVEELDFTWGSLRTRNVAFHGDVARLDANDQSYAKDDFWAVPVKYNELIGDYEIDEEIFYPFSNQEWGGYFNAYWTHPDRGHFRGPVMGRIFITSFI